MVKQRQQSILDNDPGLTRPEPLTSGPELPPEVPSGQEVPYAAHIPLKHPIDETAHFGSEEGPPEQPKKARWKASKSLVLSKALAAVEKILDGVSPEMLPMVLAWIQKAYGPMEEPS